MPKPYTFQRPRRNSAQQRNSAPPRALPLRNSNLNKETYITIDEDHDYTKYTFYTVLMMLVILLACIGYIWFKGIPTKIRG